MVVWPNEPTAVDQRHRRLLREPRRALAVKIQGVGPGGVPGHDGTSSPARGSTGSASTPTTSTAPVDQHRDELRSDDPATVPDGAVVTFLGSGNTFGAAYTGVRARRPHITGGDEGGCRPGEPNTINGANRPRSAARCASHPGRRRLPLRSAQQRPDLEQPHRRQQRRLRRRRPGRHGLHARTTPTAARRRTGRTPTSPSPTTGSRDNGGTNLAGGIGLFDGSDELRRSTTTTSAATSPPSTAAASATTAGPTAGAITANRDLPQPVLRRGRRRDDRRRAQPEPHAAFAGCGGHESMLTIDGNLVQDNLANDDGGGIRFLSGRQRSGSTSPTTRSSTTSRRTKVAGSRSTTRRTSASSATR